MRVSFLAAPLAIIAPAAHASVYLSVEQAQQAIFPKAKFVPADLTLTDTQARAIATRSGVRVRVAEQRIWRVEDTGWFIVDEVVGKHELIKYAVGIDRRGTLRGIEILEYRESHGGEIRDAKWRGQFLGKTAADPLQLDRDIRNISGATLSCRHLTDGVKRLLALYETELRDR